MCSYIRTLLRATSPLTSITNDILTSYSPTTLPGVREDLLNEHETNYPLAYKQQAEQHQRELELLINGSGKLVFLDKVTAD